MTRHSISSDRTQTAPADGDPEGAAITGRPIATDAPPCSERQSAGASAPKPPAPDSIDEPGRRPAVTLADLDQAILPLVTRPGRYVPAIMGLQEAGADTDVRVAIVGPDLIDTMIMEPSVSALYYGVHDQPGAAAELVFQPAPDLEVELRGCRLPLASLETQRPLADFDLILIPLTHALQAIGILTVLDLGGLQCWSDRRSDTDPLIVAVGPGVANPEPLAPFLDAVVLGDAVVALPDLMTAARARRRGVTRRDRLAELDAVAGIYVPSTVSMEEKADGMLVAAPGTPVTTARHAERHTVEARRLQPLIEARDGAVELEVMRGCPRRCRFCQPAWTEGPVREGDPTELQRAARALLSTGGWNEIALGGLMPGDWSRLRAGAEGLGRELLGTGTALSMTSASGQSLSRNLLAELSRMRRTALHLAPEAGSERLRRLIGKPLDEPALLEAVRNAAKLGWPAVRLHFMLGLPTETGDDLSAIVDLVARVRVAGKRSGSALQVHMMVHPFIPRAHTPLQWEPQLDADALDRRLRDLRRKCRKIAGRLKWRRPSMIDIEGLLARGDRRLARVIELAYEQGARLEGWSEYHRPEAWERALSACGLDLASYRAARQPGEPLPWSHLSLGWSEADLAAEAEASRSASGATPRPAPPAAAVSSPAPASRLPGGGPEGGPEGGPGGGIESERDTSDRRRFYGRSRKRRRGQGPPSAHDQVTHRYRVSFVKSDASRFISHLDLVRVMDRALRRAGLYVAYSTGYSRHPRLSFGPPLSVGMVGADEYFDVEFTSSIEQPLVDRLNATLPPGILALESRPITSRVASLMSLIDHADFSVTLPAYAKRLVGHPGNFAVVLGAAVDTFLSHERAYVVQRGPKGERPVEIRAGVRRLEMIADGDDAYPVLELSLRLAGDGAVRPYDLMGFLLGEHRLDPRLLRVERTRLYGVHGEHELTPFDAVGAIAPSVGAAYAVRDGQAGDGRPHVKGNRDQRRSLRDKDRHSRRW